MSSKTSPAKDNLPPPPEKRKRKNDYAYANLSNRIAQQANVLYFVHLFGGESPANKRAQQLLDVVSTSRLPRITRVYNKPALFGFETPSSYQQLTDHRRGAWINCKGFVETVVRKDNNEDTEASHKGPPYPLYRAVVKYLLREGKLSEDLFDKRYITRGNFSQTFKKLYANVDPKVLAFRETLVGLRKTVTEQENTWKKMVYDELVSEIVKGRLLSEPEEHFDYDQCCTLTKTDGSVQVCSTADQISQSSLGEDLKKEISRRLRNS